MKINIIGGGIIGLFSAFYLQQEGHEIQVFDKSDLSDGCSYGNAGMIVPSHFIPLAAPGVIAKGIRWMFDSKSPFYIKPRLDLDLANWLWRFYRSCNMQQAAAAMPALLEFNLKSKKCYQAFYQETGIDFKLEEKGILMLSQTAKGHQEEIKTAEKANELGLKTKIMGREEVKEFEKGTPLQAAGGVFYLSDAYLYPNILLQHLKSILVERGVQLHGNQQVDNFEEKGNKITAIYANGEKHLADATVLATGSWSALLLKKLGFKLLLQDGKGYSITFKAPRKRPQQATIFTEAKVTVTPMGKDLRFAGTLELGGLNPKINLSRVRGILDSIPKYYPDLKVEMPSQENIWYGYRPCSPDGLPYLGLVKNYENLVLATGHAMMGLSLGPASGKMVSDILTGKEINPDFTKFFDPNRYFKSKNVIGRRSN